MSKVLNFIQPSLTNEASRADLAPVDRRVRNHDALLWFAMAMFGCALLVAVVSEVWRHR